MVILMMQHVEDNDMFMCCQLSIIGRCEYAKTCSLLVQLFDEAAQRYQEMISNGNQTLNMKVEEGTCLLCLCVCPTACVCVPCRPVCVPCSLHLCASKHVFICLTVCVFMPHSLYLHALQPTFSWLTAYVFVPYSQRLCALQPAFVRLTACVCVPYSLCLHAFQPVFACLTACVCMPYSLCLCAGHSHFAVDHFFMSYCFLFSFLPLSANVTFILFTAFNVNISISV